MGIVWSWSPMLEWTAQGFYAMLIQIQYGYRFHLDIVNWLYFRDHGRSYVCFPKSSPLPIGVEASTPWEVVVSATSGSTKKTLSGWWFGTFFIFPYSGNNHPNWLIYFRGVETTNQSSSGHGGNIACYALTGGNLRLFAPHLQLFFQLSLF